MFASGDGRRRLVYPARNGPEFRFDSVRFDKFTVIPLTCPPTLRFFVRSQRDPDLIGPYFFSPDSLILCTIIGYRGSSRAFANSGE